MGFECGLFVCFVSVIVCCRNVDSMCLGVDLWFAQVVLLMLLETCGSRIWLPALVA